MVKFHNRSRAQVNGVGENPLNRNGENTICLIVLRYSLVLYESISCYKYFITRIVLRTILNVTYPVGARGNVYIGGGFSHSKRAKLNVTVATWNTEVMAIQNGTEVYVGVTEVTEYEPMVTTITGTCSTKFKAMGVTGSEIGMIYKLNDDGTYGKVYTQGTSAASGVFTYAPATKAITFATADAAELKEVKLVCAYTRQTENNAQVIEISGDAIPSTVLVTAFGLAKDSCNGELYPAQIEGTAQVDANYTFELSADGEPAIQSLNLEFVKSCTSKKLYDFKIYTEDVPTP